MSDLLMVYLGAGLLLVIAGAAFAAVVRFAPALVAAAPERWHRWGWLLLGLALALPVAWRLGGTVHRGPAPIEIWKGNATWEGGPQLPRMSVGWGGAVDAKPVVRLERWAMKATLGLGLAGILASAVILGVRRRRLRALCEGLVVIKRAGRVRICASDVVPIPFAARAGGLAYIVVPTALVADTARLRLVISHEAHHHRRGDLLSALGLEALRALFFWNPIVASWERALVELQDLACDRHVLRRRAVSATDYGHCLLWAAELAQQPRYILGGARAMASSGSSLRRRMVALLGGGVPRRGGAWLAGALTLSALGGTSWLVHGAVADRRVSASEVAEMAARIERRTGFHVIADEQVVEALNRKVASPEARAPLRAAFARMPQHRAMIEEVLKRKGLPRELLAVPLTESGFNNEARTSRPVERRAVGMWQLMPGVARKLGLEVSETRDERLDPRRDTEAATSLLAENHARLHDWPLAIAAYNGGIKAVETLIAGASIEEARARILANSKIEYGRYLASAMASIILIDNPQLLD
jgi:membrane-bound lytic murein transglycosylase D